MTDRPPRRIGRWPFVILAIVALLALLLAAFPWGLMKGTVERGLSKRFGRPVTIGAMHRRDHFSYSPTIELRDLRIPQAGWAGKGDLARIGRLVVTVPLTALLGDGRSIRALHIEHMKLDLVRAADGRESWRSAGATGDNGDGGGFIVDDLRISDGWLRYSDAKRGRSVDSAIEAGSQGLTLDGTGKVLGSPVMVKAYGAPLKQNGRWPFRATLSGPALDMTIAGTMAAPLDTHHLIMAVRARAANLSHLDAIIEAGLPRTQPVTVRAVARRHGADWTVTRMTGTVGRSDIAGEATIRKRGERHLIDASLRARQFDFDDLADARGRAVAAEKRQRLGPRIFPDTAIDLDNLRRTDGVLRVHAARLLWPGPSPFRSLDGTLKLDHGLLTVDDLRLGLTHGAMTGKVRIDQQESDNPVLSLDLALRGARIIDFAPDTQIDGQMRGRLRLSGPGTTIRDAIGRSSGMIGIVARDGTLPARTAALLGQDLLSGVFGSKKKQARMRCAVIRLDATGGIATAAPILVDTTRARTEMTGRIMLADERLALEMRGMPKQDADLRLVGPVLIAGTVKAPDIALPGRGGVIGNLFKSIGRAIDGKEEPLATDADCAALAVEALTPDR